MKKLTYLSLLTIAILLFTSFTKTENDKKKKILLDVIVQSINTSHYTVPEWDNDLSLKIFDEYIKAIDNTKRFLIISDYNRLSDYKYRLDNEIKDGTFEFFNLSYEIIRERIIEVEKIYQELLKKPFDFEINESLNADYDNLTFAASKEELREYWRQSLKYQVMTRVAEKLNTQEKAQTKNDSSITVKTFEEIEESARNSVIKSHNEWFARLQKLTEEEYFSFYLNAIVSTIDPHTNYYPPKDKENFDIAMSGRLEGIGATLQEKDGYIKVVRIVPGSASWKQGELEANDIILKVAQDGEEAVDIAGMKLDDAVKMIRGKKGTKVILTVRKIDGSVITIGIIRDIVIIDETYAKSIIIEDKTTNKKIGFINLPQFYADFTGTGGRRCGIDMKDEVLKLMKEGVDGIIIDLRNNGGGSLPDVVDIAGLFINSGPVVQVKSRWGEPYILEDKDPSLIYDGPLVVIVNSLSASASEIFAAAMQDYKRAVIIGSSATFGKVTVQRFIELDNYILVDDSDVKPLGSLKITMQKFYRINGHSTQLNGVIPDIVLPDAYKYIDIGEREYDHALNWDEITKVPYSVWNNSLNIQSIINNSISRISNDTIFNLIEENAKYLKTQSDEKSYSLVLSDYRKELENKNAANKKFKKIERESTDLLMKFVQTDFDVFKADTSKMARMEDWQKNLMKDVYVHEAVNVITDICNNEKSQSKR